MPLPTLTPLEFGTAGNPVVDVGVDAGQLVITFADGTTETLDLPAGSSAVVDAPDGRLPGAPVEMRIAWSDGGPLTADSIYRGSRRNSGHHGRQPKTRTHCHPRFAYDSLPY